MKYISKIVAGLIACLLLCIQGLRAQSTQLTITPANPTVCSGSVTLTANLPQSLTGTTWPSPPDDGYTGIVNLGFNFTFFGNTYSQCLVSSNNYITFDLTNAGGYSPWSIPGPIPSTSDPMNSIMCPWQDLYPPGGGTITYATLGSAPNRVFVVAYCSVAMFSCTSLLFTSQIQLFETSNIIQTHISAKPLCSTWNGGQAIHGIQNSTGTIAFVHPGRNAPTQWTTTLEGYQWTPTGTNSYSMGTVPYAPVILSSTTGPVQWYVGATLVGTGPTLTVSPTTTTTYTATVTGGCIGTSTGTDTVFVGNLNATITSTNSSCSAATGTATISPVGGVAPFTYSWNTSPAQTTATASNLVSGNYCAVVTDSQGCRDSLCVAVSATGGVTASQVSQTNVSCFGACDGIATGSIAGGTGPYTYSWNTVPAQTTATATGLCAGSWLFKATDANGCFDTIRFTITQPAQLTMTPPANDTICIGQSASLVATAAGGTAPYTFSWSAPNFTGSPYVVSPVVTTSYSVFATDANGCSTNPRNVIVYVRPPLNVTATASTDSLCTGFSTNLTATGSGGNSNLTYTWLPGNMSGDNITVSPTVTTTYTVIVNDGCSTPSDSATIPITVYPLPIPTFTADKLAACPTLCVNFTNTTPLSSTCFWTLGDGNTSAQLNTVNHCYPNTGQYTISLKVKDIHGCVNTTTTTNMITVYPVPTADFTAFPQPTTLLNPTVHFTDVSNGASSWAWTFGQTDSTSLLQNPNFTFPDTGTYNVQLIIKNSNGCSDTVAHPIIILPDYAIYVPNAFTPNGDGINDIFLPQGTGIQASSFDMYIFDRWGNTVFHTTDLNKGWDGKSNGGGAISQIDTYVWKISFRDYEGSMHKYIGHVSLLK